jgi:hypothetical protein
MRQRTRNKQLNALRVRIRNLCKDWTDDIQVFGGYCRATHVYLKIRHTKYPNIPKFYLEHELDHKGPKIFFLNEELARLMAAKIINKEGKDRLSAMIYGTLFELGERAILSLRQKRLKYGKNREDVEESRQVDEKDGSESLS